MKRIEICGNIASGKTTLCQGLVSKGYIPIFEDFSKNPFFLPFYQNPQAFSFETEVTFLLQHYHSIKLQETDNMIACDYSFFLDLAYADVNLSGNRHKIFCEILLELQSEIALPSQIIQLVCPQEVLRNRIVARRRALEKSVTIHYLRSLARAISLRIEEISDQVPVISIDSNAIDFTLGIEGIRELDSL